MFNPCGMVWTYLRSCYTFTMRLFIGGQEQEFPARWYFCADGALPFPGVHGAEASPWLKTSIGEVNAAWGEVTPWPTDPNGATGRGLDRGLNPGYRGKCFIGDPQWFVDGKLPASVLINPPPPMAGCCQALPQVSSGGIVLGGTSAAFEGATICSQCPKGTRRKWTLTVRGGTGAFQIFRGTYILPWSGADCQWLLFVGNRSYELLGRNNLPGLWQVGLVQLATSATYKPTGGFDCVLGAVNWTLDAQTGFGFPPTVQIS